MGVGAQLRQARLARGLTVREIADITKISTRQIDAIETEHYEKLPGGIFGRGYVRAIAIVLKLDADTIVEAYRDETEEERTVAPLPAASAPADPPRRQAAQTVSMAWRLEREEPRIHMAAGDVVSTATPSRVAAVVLIGFGVLLLMLWFGREQAGPVSQAPATAPAPRAQAEPHGATKVPAAPGATPSSRERPIGTVGQGAEAARAEPPGRLTDIHIVAQREAWVVLTVDGERVARRMLRPLEAVHARMRRQATLETGDAGALLLSIDGDEPRPAGPPGAVRTIAITPPR